MIKATNHKISGNTLEFDVSGVEPAALNTLRRTIMAGVPVMAVEKVTFYNNSSILNDENLAQRFGLVPLTTDLRTYNLRDECECKGKGCGRCVCVMTLDVTGPATVYSGEFKSKDENIRPVHENIPLVKLMAQQKIKAEVETILGYGREHIKWQPGIASYEKKKDGTYHVTVESYGQLPVEELLNTAFEVVGKKINKLKEEIT